MTATKPAPQWRRAAVKNERTEPGTDQHRQTLGYMVAAEDRMQAIGC